MSPPSTPPPSLVLHRSKVPSSVEESLSSYASTLRDEGEISELILRLESLARKGEVVVLQDPGVKELVEETNLNLQSSQEVHQAILVLGERGAALREARISGVPALPNRDLGELVLALLPVLEATRLSQEGEEGFEARLHEAVEDSLRVLRRNQPPRTPQEEQWWEEARRTLRERLVPGYLVIALRLNRLEEGTLTRSWLKSPWAMGLLWALPGLLTLPVPVSTPLVMLFLALLGTYVIHPLWMSHVTEPLQALQQNLAAEAPRVARWSGGSPFSEADTSTGGALADLLPILEGERRAGRGDERSLRLAVNHWFDEVAARKGESFRGARYFHHLREYFTGPVVRRFFIYGRARSWVESRLWRRLLDIPWASALGALLLGWPLALLATLATPFPPTVEFPFMLLLLAVGGYGAPHLVPGTRADRDALIQEVHDHQGELNSLP